MKSYELTYIISSSASSEQMEGTIKEIETFIQGKGGVILRSEKTSAQTLAYPIKKHSSGYFVILTFQTAEDTIKPIKERVEKDQQILRSFILVKKPAKEMKERRTRKPFVAPESDALASPVPKFTEDKHKGEKVKAEEIDKKLEEILGE